MSILMFEEKVKVLVVDDTLANVKLIQKFIEPKGYQVAVASNGQEAVEMYQADRPEIVLMDVMMPVVNGYEATKRIRELDKDHWVPLIFLSAKTTIDDQIEAIALGGDDYLTKPVDLRLLEAKLSAMMRIVKVQRELKSTSLKLMDYVAQADAELDLAKRLMSNMLCTYTVEGLDNVQRFNVAAKVISGDISIVFKAKNKLYILLADATGHGLSAAISLMPATQLFHSMVKRERSVSEIAVSINQMLKALLPSDRFVAATIATINEVDRSIEVWNGSNPPPIIVDEKGQLLKMFEQTNFALGIVDGDAFTAETEVYQYSSNNELLIYSDGLTELVDVGNNVFGVEGVISILNSNSDEISTPHGNYFLLRNYAENLIDGRKYSDDVSLISVQSLVS